MRPPRWRCPGIGLLLALVGLAGLPVLGQTSEDPPAPGDAYAPGNFGRVRYEENGLTILRSETEAMREFPSAGQVNAPIFPGDIVTTNSEQRGEVQLAEGSVVRVDHDSQVVFLALSDPYVEVPDNTVVQVATGAIRLEALIDEQEEFRVDTPACTIYISGDADVRVEVRGERTLIASRRGIAEVETGSGSLVVRGGMATEVRVGDAPQDSRPFNTFLADEFDRWVADREERLAVEGESKPAVAEVYEELPDEVRPYYRELSLHGAWVRNDTFGPIWIPETPKADWRPYGHGRWGYGPRGYFWVSHEPWGWAPYHFGRWTWVPGFGWSWVPGRVFGGAWVSWSWGPSHMGWCALDYWNRPIRRAAATQGVYDARTWTFISYDNLTRINSAAYHVNLEKVSDLEESVVVARSPRVAPSELTRTDARTRVIADARASSASWVQGPVPDDTVARSRPFVELEKQAGLERRATLSDELAPGKQAIAATPVSKSTPQGTTPSSESAIRGFAASPQPQASPTGPGLKRPLVHSEQDKLEGASERWKDIYRKMSQPRPTRSQERQENPGESDDDKAGRKAPARQSKASRPPDRGGGGDGARRSERPTPGTVVSGRGRPTGTADPRFTNRRSSSRTRFTPNAGRVSSGAPKTTGRPVSAPGPRPAVAAPRPTSPRSSPAKPAPRPTRESPRGRRDPQR